MEIKKILMDNQEEDTVENLGETNEVLEELHKNTEGTSEETRGQELQNSKKEPAGNLGLSLCGLLEFLVKYQFLQSTSSFPTQRNRA